MRKDQFDKADGKRSVIHYCAGNMQQVEVVLPSTKLLKNMSPKRFTKTIRALRDHFYKAKAAVDVGNASEKDVEDLDILRRYILDSYAIKGQQ